MLGFITGIVRTRGLLGVALLMLIENLVPVIPSELIMPLAGFEAAQGRLEPLGVVLAGTFGSILGGTAWYALARWLGPRRFAAWAARYGRWLTVSPDDVVRGEAWFRRWGAVSVCVGRALPGVRGVICIPAGLARMPWGGFLVWSSLGALVWTALLTGAGYLLRANFGLAERWMGPVADAFLGFCLLVYVVRLLRPRARQAPDRL